MEGSFKHRQTYSDPEKALKMAKKVNNLAGYSRAAKVNTGLTYVKKILMKRSKNAQSCLDTVHLSSAETKRYLRNVVSPSKKKS